MAKHVIWKVGDLVNIKLRDDLYTIGQMLTSTAMRFYDISNQTCEWNSINLNNIKELFCILVGNVINKHLIENKIKNKTVISSDKPCEKKWIKPNVNFGDGFHFQGGKLIELRSNTDIDTISALVINENLILPNDRDIIEKYELTNMWGHEDLGDRLRRYFDTGINRDDLKFEVFPGLWNDREKLRPLTRRLPVPLR